MRVFQVNIPYPHTSCHSFLVVLLSVCHTYLADCQTVVRVLTKQSCSSPVVHGVIDANHALQHSPCSKLCPSTELCCISSSVFGKYCLQHDMRSYVAIRSMP